MVPLADHHWSRASASCRARCSPYRRSEVLRASQLPALLILRQPTYPFPSRSSASSPSAAFFFPYRFVPYLFLGFFFHFHTFIRFFPIPRFFMCVHRFQVFTAVYTVSPCVAVRRPHPFPFWHSRDISQSRRFSCVSIFIHILLYRCGDGWHTRVFFFPYFRHMRAVASVDRAYYLYVGFYYLRWHRFFYPPSFGRQYFAGVNWQVAKRTKVLSASM